MSAEKVIEMTAAGTDGITAMVCGGVVLYKKYQL